MTFDEWLTLSGKSNEAAAAGMNRLRGVLTPAQRAETPQATEHRISRLRLRRRKIEPGEIVLIRELTDGLVDDADWAMPPAPKAKRGGHRQTIHGIWIVFKDGVPMVETARLTRDGAWQAAGFEVPVDAVSAITSGGWECRLVARITPTREMRRAAARKP